MEIDYKYLENYVININSVYRLKDFINTLEELICYLDYYPKNEMPEYYQKFNVKIKDCKKLICLCNKRIKDIKNRVGDRK